MAFPNASHFVTLHDALSLHCVNAQLLLDRVALAELDATWRRHCVSKRYHTTLAMPYAEASAFLATLLPRLTEASSHRLGDRSRLHHDRQLEQLDPPVSSPPPPATCLVQQQLEALVLV